MWILLECSFAAFQHMWKLPNSSSASCWAQWMRQQIATFQKRASVNIIESGIISALATVLTPEQIRAECETSKAVHSIMFSCWVQQLDCFAKYPNFDCPLNVLSVFQIFEYNLLLLVCSACLKNSKYDWWTRCSLLYEWKGRRLS